MIFFLKFRWLSGIFLLPLTGCMPNYFLIHPVKPAPGIYRESGFFDHGQLRVHWLARYPQGKGPLPAILIHPDRGSLSGDMEGICLDLAGRGYFAAAAHYQRLENLEQENPLIPWRSPEDILAALGRLQKNSRVDSSRIGLLGFSRGAILSLQIASQSSAVKAVVAYYPLADFTEWLDLSRYSFPKSLLFRWVRNQVVKASGAGSYEEAYPQFRAMSPMNLTDKIKAPALLIHGEKDLTFPVDQTRRLCAKMQASGTLCDLKVVPGAGHVFNFTDKEKGQEAWDWTLRFFNRYLSPDPCPGQERAL